MTAQSEVATVLLAIPRRPRHTQGCRADDDDDDMQSRFVLNITIFFQLAT
jgi:hypothetical protein